MITYQRSVLWKSVNGELNSIQNDNGQIQLKTNWRGVGFVPLSLEIFTSVKFIWEKSGDIKTSTRRHDHTSSEDSQRPHHHSTQSSSSENIWHCGYKIKHATLWPKIWTPWHPRSLIPYWLRDWSLLLTSIGLRPSQASLSRKFQWTHWLSNELMREDKQKNW